MTPRRAALYARVSTGIQSTDLQIFELRQVAVQRGWTIVGEYSDAAVSGARDRRPELDRLMRDALRGRLDVVVVWRFDRFARSVRHLVNALHDFETCRVDFVSLRDQVDTSTAAGRLIFHVVAAIAEFERELIRERVTAGVASARRRGKRIGRRPHPVDADRAFELQAAGRSVRAIARELGVPTSIAYRALRAPAGGLCVVCSRDVPTDMHGRARWHQHVAGTLCDGTGHGCLPLADSVPKPLADDGAATA
jgi:DNA invertase Pin-like site-specific DNA recombinase